MHLKCEMCDNFEIHSRISHLFINFGDNRCNLINLMYIIDCVNARHYIEREIKSHDISISDVQIQ